MLYELGKRPKRKEFNEGFWDSFTNRDVLEDYPIHERRRVTPATNVIENKKEYILELASPGMCKDNYLIEVENDVLTISGDTEEERDIDRNYTRCEFDYASFQRSFVLPEHVDTDKIAASCSDGILTIHIPKKEEAKVEHKQNIEIS